MWARKAGPAAVLGTLAAASLVGFSPVTQAAPTLPSTYGAELIGDPTDAARYWSRQHDANCGEMAVADVVGEITGRLPTEQEINATAENTPSPYIPGGKAWFPGGYSEIRDMPALLSHYGIDARAIGNTNIDRLKQALAQGHKVIASVNATVLWSSGSGTSPDHFVVVTGIDTDANVVHLNDSGRDTGRDEQVTLATFERSWATSGNQAVVTS